MQHRHRVSGSAQIGHVVGDVNDTDIFLGSKLRDVNRQFRFLGTVFGVFGVFGDVGFLGTSYIPPVKPILLVHDYKGLKISRIFGNTPPPYF
jgi:hypothetical protein